MATKKKELHVADIVQHGEKMILPKGMGMDDAITLLRRRQKHDEQEIDIQMSYNVLPQDGAHALRQVFVQKFGWQEGKSLRSFFGTINPDLLRVQVGPDEFVEVPWGTFSLPNVEGSITCQRATNSKGQTIFRLMSTVKRKHEHIVRDIFSRVKDYLETGSLYQGKAIKIRFRDDDGDIIPLPEPQFLDLSGVRPENLILNQDLAAAVNANLFTPIERVEDCLANGMRVKRGVLLGGHYGTGKTLTAMVAAKLAQDNGITFLYCARADELADAIEFAKQYQSPASVVFCEDIDRSMSGDERTVEIDDILNILDGVDTKRDNIITILTTNHLGNINRAMLRPGRLDGILDYERPDAESAERLVRYYAGDAVEADTDLTEVGEALRDQVPAVIEEAVKRAKLFQMALIGRGEKVTNLSAEALLQSAKSMAKQIDLLKEHVPDKPPTVDRALRALVNEASKAPVTEVSLF